MERHHTRLARQLSQDYGVIRVARANSPTRLIACRGNIHGSGTRTRGLVDGCERDCDWGGSRLRSYLSQSLRYSGWPMRTCRGIVVELIQERSILNSHLPVNNCQYYHYLVWIPTFTCRSSSSPPCPSIEYSAYDCSRTSCP
jgi:hypothetical protein